MPLGGNFRSQLRYWARHAFFCATPSFILAYVGGFQSWSAVSAMLLAVMAFVVIYALFSSSQFFQSKIKPGPLGQAIHLGAKTRSILSTIGLLTYFTPGFAASRFPMFPLFPDMYCGVAAMLLSESLTSEPTYNMGSREGLDTCFRTFLITTFDGVILSGTLVVVVLACLIAIRLRRKTSAAQPV